MVDNDVKKVSISITNFIIYMISIYFFIEFERFKRKIVRKKKWL